MVAEIQPAKKIGGTMPVPPSKSMAHRMLICAALARGLSDVENLDYSVDIRTTIAALEQLGAKIECRRSSVQVEGLPGGFATVTRPVECAESGSTFRFIIPLFSLTGQQIRFTGATRLFARNLSAYEDIFARQGLAFGATKEDLVIKGSLRAGEFALPGNISSQFISGLLFALPMLEGDSVIKITTPLESAAYVELTRSAQALYGVNSAWQDERTLLIPGGQTYTAADSRVEGDWSQAAVPAVIGAVLSGVTVRGLDANSAQGDKFVLEVLERCGAQPGWKDGLLTVTPPRDGLVAPADEIDLSGSPDLGPILFVLAAFCKGKTRFVNAGRLRIKESDRIDSMQSELRKIGARVTSTSDTITVEGGYPLLGGKTIARHNDHRVIMALTAAAVCAGVDMRIDGAQDVSKSWPGFFSDIAKIGAEVTEE